MAGRSGSSSVVITCDDAPGGTSRTITPYVTTINGIKREALTVENSPFGTVPEANTPTGKVRVPDIVIEGDFNTDATSGPHVMFKSPDDGPTDATRTFTYSPDGGTSVFTMEARASDYEVLSQNGQLTRYKVTIRQAGDGAWN